MILKHPSELHIIPQRIISLVPSQTELLAYLGLTDEVVGITKFCVHPTEWRSQKAIIGGTKNINIPKIISLQPELIIANKEENIQSQVETLARDFPVWVTDVNHFADAIKMIDDIGKLVNRSQEANLLISGIHSEFELLNNTQKPIKVCYLIWKDPLMTVGNDTFIHDMLKTAGFQNIFESRKRYPEVNINEIVAAKPDVIFLSSEPYPFSEKHIQEFAKYFEDLPILLVDGEKFSWYGSHLLHSPGYFLELYQGLGN